MESHIVCRVDATVHVQASEVLPSNHSTAEKGEISMSTEENKAIVRRLIEEGFNQRNLALFDELYAPNFVYHLGSTTIEGVEAYKQFNLMNFTSIPDLR